MYTAAVLTPMSAMALEWMVKAKLGLQDQGFVFKTAQGQRLPHHMTINLGKLDEKLNSREIMGKKAELMVERLVYSDTLGVCAAPVLFAKALMNEGEGLEKGDWVDVVSNNPEPHITCCIKPQSKPKLSNQMLEFPSPLTVTVQLDEPVWLEAVIQECQ